VISTTILGYNFSAPFFISPAAKAGLANSAAEVGLVQGAYEGGILYIVRLHINWTSKDPRH
jgi:isopentenyl diphosphate isomerase/L-lactate dehydrogenase-like FMN-dependent dehydrogenase